MRCARPFWLIAMGFVGIGCGSKTAFHLPVQDTSSVVREDAGADRVAECDNAALGTVCGPAGSHMHCVSSVCVRNACGDGVVDDDEQCDDGNQRDFDGCDLHCKSEPPPGCGNGVVEPGEECDDGNASDDDACTHLCTQARCGDRIKSRGEECDDGNQSNSDGCTTHCTLTQSTAGGGAGGSAGSGAVSSAGGGGSSSSTVDAGTPAADGGGSGGASGMVVAGAGGAGSPAPDGGVTAAGTGGVGGSAPVAGTSAAIGGGGGGGGTVSAACASCRDMNCRDYMGLGADLVDGCLVKVNPVGGADPNDSMFISDCTNMLQCAYQNDCAYGANGASACYCGSATIDQCMQSGPAADAKCVSAYQRATRSMMSAEISTRTSDFAYPIAWAFYLLECDRDLCASSCDPP